MSHRLPIQAQDVASYYKDGLSMDMIATKLSTSKRIIANRLIEAGVKSRGFGERYHCRLNRSIVEYFKDWGNQSAYILGYTMADGSISRSLTRSPSVQFSCVKGDREILDGIVSELQLPFELKPRLNGTQLSLRIHGEAVVSLFESFGIVSRKSYIDCPFPEMPRRCLPHYIRGVLDGDGCVHYNPSTRVMSVQFLGQQSFITGLRAALIAETGINKTGVLQRPGHWCVAWQSARQIKAIHDFLYPVGNYICLSRKREKFRSIISNEYHS